MDAGPPAQRLHLDAAVVRERWQPARLRRRMRLDPGVALERLLRLRRLRQPEFPGGDGLDAEGREERPHLPHLPRIMGGDDEPPGFELPAHAIAAFCAETSSPTPFRASFRSSRSCASEKGEPSAEPCTSTIPPDPVRTKFASVPAAESSA